MPQKPSFVGFRIGSRDIVMDAGKTEVTNDSLVMYVHQYIGLEIIQLDVESRHSTEIPGRTPLMSPCITCGGPA